jgi:transposase
MESEAEMSSDASFQASVTPVYKQYTEQNLLAAIKAVLCDGMKQAEASVKFCIPFTTLTRKIRLYQACGGRLPTKRREKPRVHDVCFS